MEGASNICLPILTEGANQFQARGYKALFPSREFISAYPLKDGDEDAFDAAERYAKKLNYELTIIDRNYRRDKNDMLLAIAIHGSDFSKVRWDGRKKVVERVRAEDLVVPFGKGPRRIEDLPRKSHLIYMPVRDSKIYALDGYFISTIEGDDEYSEDRATETVQYDVEGQRPEGNYETADYGCVIEQHCYLDIGEDDNKIELPYIVTVCKKSKKILRLQRRYLTSMGGDPIDSYAPVEQFTHYQYLPNPNGFYGLGIGHVVASLNIASNQMVRKIIDAATLANDGNMSGFISDSLGIKGNDVELTIGKFAKTPRRAQDLRDGIFTFSFPGPNPAMVQMSQYVIDIARRVANATDVVSGDLDKVMQPMTIMTMLDSALQLPTAVMEQVAGAVEEELWKLHQLDRVYQTEPVTFYEDGKPERVEPHEMQRDYRIVPIMDPKSMTKNQKMAKAQELYNMVMNNPLLSQNPDVVKQAAKRFMQAMEVEDIDEIMPDDPEPERFDSQHQENMFFLMPPDSRPLFDVFPDQDHIQHIMDIDNLLGLLDEAVMPDVSPNEIDQAIISAIVGMGDEIKTQVVSELLRHRQKHIAYMYGQDQGAIDGQGKIIPVAKQAGNPMGAGSPMGALPGIAESFDMPLGGGQNLSGPSGGDDILAGIGAGGTPPGLIGLASLDYGRSINGVP